MGIWKIDKNGKRHGQKTDNCACSLFYGFFSGIFVDAFSSLNRLSPARA